MCTYYSLYGGMWNLFCRADTILVFTIFYGLFGEGTRLAMPNIMRVGLIVIEARYRGY